MAGKPVPKAWLWRLDAHGVIATLKEDGLLTSLQYKELLTMLKRLPAREVHHRLIFIMQQKSDGVQAKFRSVLRSLFRGKRKAVQVSDVIDWDAVLKDMASSTGMESLWQQEGYLHEKLLDFFFKKKTEASVNLSLWKTNIDV